VDRLPLQQDPPGDTGRTRSSLRVGAEEEI